jgi:hypothetical protein
MRTITPLFLALVVCVATLAATPGVWAEMEDSAWHPSANVVARIKQKIQPAVEKQAKAQGLKLRPWNEYSFEYQGRISAGEHASSISSQPANQRLAPMTLRR